MTSAATKQVDARVVVETPEGVDFTFQIAGPGIRMNAWVIDMVVKGLILAFVAAIISITATIAGGWNGTVAGFEITKGVVSIAFFLLDWFYGSFFEGFRSGQTPGKKHYGLRVVRTNGTPVDLLSATGRNFLKFIDLIPGTWGIAVLCMISTRRLQRLGDLCFDTMVIQEARNPGGRTAGLVKGVEPLVRSECSRRYSVPDRTLAMIERLFAADRIISDARREELAKPLSLAIRKRLGWQPPGPDPANPYTFYQNQADQHTRFLRQVLRTFALDDSPIVRQSEPGDRRAHV
jgi:uncharacterized RDD family membrane protein YckC